MPKKGGLGQFADLRGAWQERGGVFQWGEGGVDTPMHTMNTKFSRYFEICLWLFFNAFSICMVVTSRIQFH